MFEVFTNTQQSLAENAPIAFDTVKFDDCRINLSTDHTTITIKAPGRYLLHFDGVGGSDTAATALQIQLFVDGTAQPQAYSSNVATLANDNNPLSFDVLLVVQPSCYYVNKAQTIQIKNVSAETGTITHANLVIIHL